MAALSVIIADDHQLVRAALRQLISAQAGFTVVADCRTGKETLTALQTQSCHVLLLDLSLPDMSGLDVLRTVRTRYPATAVLVLSGYPERQFGINVLRAGANGFISKGVDEVELLRAIRTVARGGRYVGPELAELLVNSLDSDPDKPTHSVLSEREFQILCKLADGHSVTEIAKALCLSVKTVSTYRSRVLEKMGMRTNADITSYAIHNRLIQ
jgi:DNA-binding NarL/FixJ family response regulator